MGCGGGCASNSGGSLDIKDEELKKKTEMHPCYSEGGHKYARMHMPVAPACNIQCNYCNRLYDCVNESRPGVTSEVLLPDEALEKYKFVKSKMENLQVVGIAGPGDAFANWENTKETIKLIKEFDPNMTPCLSTNGLMLPKYVDEIVELGVSHVTVTMNSIDPEIGAQIYEYISYEGNILKGREAALILQNNQLEGIKRLVEKGVLVKVNIVMVKGINDRHIPQVTKKAKELGAFMTNIMPLIPAKGTAFENMPLVSNKELNELRKECSVDIKQMYHCQQCRADAIGVLNQDRSLEFRNFKKKTGELKFAVASKDGILIDQHFGHVDKFYIYGYDKINGAKLLEERKVEKYCAGKESCSEDEKKSNALETIADCNAVLSVRIGYEPKRKLKAQNIESIELYDTIEEGIRFAAKKYA